MKDATGIEYRDKEGGSLAARAMLAIINSLISSLTAAGLSADYFTVEDGGAKWRLDGCAWVFQRNDDCY